MENTEMNKIIFFTQYWNQRVWRRTQGEGNLLYINQDTISAKKGSTFHDYLELKSLESITDEDAIYLLGLSNLKSLEIKRIEKTVTGLYADYRWISNKVNNADGYSYSEHGLLWDNLTPKQVDILRLKGFAYEWAGLSVEELVNRGWIKLKH